MRWWVACRHPLMLSRFRRRMGYWPDPAWPRTHNERVLWRKIFDRNPAFVTLTDKVAVKAVIAERCAELRQARLLWVGTGAAALPGELLAGGVMLKANNGCGANLAVRGGVPGREAVARRMRRWLTRGRRREEWAHWPIVPTVLAEELLELGGNGVPTDIKVHVCAGEVAHLWAVDKRSGASIMLDAGGRASGAVATGHKPALEWSERLGELAREAARLAPVLASGLDYVRVDFLVTAGGPAAGELTVYPASGFDRWSDRAVAGRLERLWDIRRSHFVQTDAGPYAAALRESWRP